MHKKIMALDKAIDQIKCGETKTALNSMPVGYLTSLAGGMNEEDFAIALRIFEHTSLDFEQIYSYFNLNKVKLHPTKSTLKQNTTIIKHGTKGYIELL